MEENKNIIPIPRELDGIYYRVERDGKWCNRCFTDLTTDEQEEMIKKYDAEGLKRMVMLLAKILRDIGDIFNIVAKDEDDEYTVFYI